MREKFPRIIMVTVTWEFSPVTWIHILSGNMRPGQGCPRIIDLRNEKAKKRKRRSLKSSVPDKSVLKSSTCETKKQKKVIKICPGQGCPKMIDLRNEKAKKKEKRSSKSSVQKERSSKTSVTDKGVQKFPTCDTYFSCSRKLGYLGAFWSPTLGLLKNASGNTENKCICISVANGYS